MARPLPRAVAAPPAPALLARQAFLPPPPLNASRTSRISGDGDADDEDFAGTSTASAAISSYTSMPQVGNATWEMIGRTRGTPIFSGEPTAVGPQTNVYIFVYPDNYSSVISPGAKPSTRALLAAAAVQTSLASEALNATSTASLAPTASSEASEAQNGAAPVQHGKKGAVAGALIGMLLLVFACVSGFFYLRRRRRCRAMRAERDYGDERATPMAEKHDGLSSASSRRSMHLASRPESMLSFASRSSLQRAPLSPARNPFDDPNGADPFGDGDSFLRSPSMLSLAQSQDSSYAPSMTTMSSNSRPIRSEGPYPLPPRTPLAPRSHRRPIDPRVHTDLLDAHGERDVDYARASFSTDVSRAMWMASQSGASSSRGSLRTSASMRDVADEADASSAASFVRSRPTSWRSLSTNDEAEMWQQRAAAAAKRASSHAESIRSASSAGLPHSTSRPRLAINTSSQSIPFVDPFSDDAPGSSSSSQERTLTAPHVKKVDESTVDASRQPPMLQVIAPTPSTHTHSAVDGGEETLPRYSAWR